MEQVALLDQLLITSLLSHSKNYSLFKTLYTASANLVWPRRINSPCTNLFLLCGISCCFLYSYCLTELAQLIFFFILLNKTDFNTLALCGTVYRREQRVAFLAPFGYSKTNPAVIDLLILVYWTNHNLKNTFKGLKTYW